MTYMTEDEVMAINEALANDRNYSVEYVDALPEDVRAEVIDGRDCERNLILIYRFEQSIVEFHSFHDRIKAGIFEGLEIDFGASRK